MSVWLKPKKAAIYAGIGERTLRTWLKHGLKYSRLPSGAILIKSQWIDEYLEAFTVTDEGSIDRIVEEICKGI